MERSAFLAAVGATAVATGAGRAGSRSQGSRLIIDVDVSHCGPATTPILGGNFYRFFRDTLT